MEIQAKNNAQKIEPIDWKWLMYLSLSAIAIMILGIENALEKKISFVIFALLTFIPIIVTRKPGIAGLTRKNLKSSMLAGSCAGIIYGIFRGLVLKFIPGGTLILGADLAIIAAKLETGIQFGSLILTKDDFLLLLLVLPLMFPMMIGLELYFRGLLFLTLKKYVHWTGAVAIASTVQAISRRTPHSLVMGSIGGVLMQKYDNILAPSFMHGFQFFTAFAIFLYL